MHHLSTDQIDPELGSHNSKTYLITLITVGKLARLLLLAVTKKYYTYHSNLFAFFFLHRYWYRFQLRKVSCLESCF